LFALRQGKIGNAVELLRDASAAAERAGDSLLTINALMALAGALEAAGNFDNAMSTYTDALQRCDLFSGGRVMREEILFRVGNAMLRREKPDDAGRFFQAALGSARSRGNILGRAYALLQLSHCARLRREGTAIALAQEAVELLREPQPPLPWHTPVALWAWLSWQETIQWMPPMNSGRPSSRRG